MNRKKFKKCKYLLLGVSILLLFAGCTSSWLPSDEEAVYLLKDYYAYYEGRDIEASLVSRGEYDEKCECLSMEFHLLGSKKGGYNKIFYFFKTDSGKVGIRKYKFGIKRT